MRHALRPLRRVVRRLHWRKRPVILMYHRVANPGCDPWRLAVRPENFDAQIGALVNMYRIVPLSWLARELADGRVSEGTAAVTFDDGYADVLEEGKPVLERHGCPTTMFLTTGAIGSTEDFWWDELSELVLGTTSLPPVLEIEIGASMHRWQLGTVADDRIPAMGKGKISTRENLHLDLWKLLRPLSALVRRQHLDTLARWADSQPRSRSRVLTAEEVRRLAEPGFIDIGAHSVTHPTFPTLDPAAVRAEVVESKHVCEALSSTPSEGFAYPFGDYDDASVRCVGEAGFQFACTTDSGIITDRCDVMRLPRFAVGDWGAERFASWLRSSAM
jgi:peptidoglycan/xylan/chitin deacetylase (PgdA/CDA1 family)